MEGKASFFSGRESYRLVIVLQVGKGLKYLQEGKRLELTLLIRGESINNIITLLVYKLYAKEFLLGGKRSRREKVFKF